MQRRWNLETALLFILFLLCIPIETYSAGLQDYSELGNLPSSYFDVCKHDLDTYPSLRAEIDKRHPAGSDAASLLATIKLTLGSAASEKIVTDFLLTANTDKVTGNSWLYSFKKRCSYSSIYDIEWNIHILTDLSQRITAINIQPIMQASDFSLIPAPFCFEYFTNDQETQKALWSLTGIGTPKKQVLALMSRICSEYGEIESLKMNNGERSLGYRYRYIKTAFIASRILPWEFSSIVIWEFDEQDKLIHLTVR